MRLPKMQQKVFRVIGRSGWSGTGPVKTWKFWSEADARHRADTLRAIGALIEFSHATVDWQPVPEAVTPSMLDDAAAVSP